ncbi:flagellar motor switch protein FliM [Granulicella cerasi]|uniref:Flagellar motor switch protein FliM n=1 Tax=Granulicella cerasi TaxID=741063 RepID=A0ABW1Z4I4_9BACT|nr:hypothetical protein [Granulicella cerasi]
MNEEEAVVMGPEEARPYNFSRSGQISTEQMQAIAMVNDGIARNLTHTLGAWLRSQVQIALAETTQQTYGEYLAGIADPAYVCMLRLEPLSSMGMIELDLSLVFSIVDVLLGGKGHCDQAREVTEIEEAVLSSVLAIVMRELNTAWQTVGLEFHLEKREARARMQRLRPASKRMLVVSFDVQLEETQAKLRLCLPIVTLNTIHRRLIAVREQPRRDFGAGSARLASLMGQSQFRMALRTPSTKISSQVLRELAPGHVLELGIPRSASSELVVGNLRLLQAVPVAKAELRAGQVYAEPSTAKIEERAVLDGFMTTPQLPSQTSSGVTA